MYKELAELTVKKSEDYDDKVVKVLEDAGFTVVLRVETYIDRKYIIAEGEDKG